MSDELAFAFGITGPVLLLLVLGRALRATSIVDAHFVARANALVFDVALPALLFFSIAGRPLGAAFDLRLTLTGLVGTLVLIALLLGVGWLLPKDQRGVFVQGSYRGNLAILGVALAVATYGDDVLPLVALYIAVVTTVYNVVVSPLLLVGLGLAAGLDGERLGVLFFLAASLTASASYIMARQMTVHGALAAEIIAVTTALGVIGYTAGLALLRGAGLV